ncbi:MAG: DnaA/Hda family protein [Rhodospirillaceae bacterium]
MNSSQQIPFEFEHLPALGGDDFFVAPSNNAVVQWIDKWPHWPSPVLVIFGPSGAGKTHLANVFAERTGAKFLDKSRFLTEEVPNLLNESQCFVADDMPDEFEEEALLHLYNSARDLGGHLLMTSVSPPVKWSLGLKDLASRLNAAVAVEIGHPEDELIQSILIKLFSDRQLLVNKDVVTYILPRVERSIEAVRHLVEVLDKAALSQSRNITLPLVREVMAALAEIHSRP